MLELQFFHLGAADKFSHFGLASVEILAPGHEPGRLLLDLFATLGGPTVETVLLADEFFVLLRQLAAEPLEFFFFLVQLQVCQAIVVGEAAANLAQRPRQGGRRSGAGEFGPQFLGCQANL